MSTKPGREGKRKEGKKKGRGRKRWKQKGKGEREGRVPQIPPILAIKSNEHHQTWSAGDKNSKPKARQDSILCHRRWLCLALMDEDRDVANPIQRGGSKDIRVMETKPQLQPSMGEPTEYFGSKQKIEV